MSAFHGPISVPITLTANVAAAPGTKVMLDKVSLTNPFQTHMLIDEFQVLFDNWTSNRGHAHTQFRLKLARQELTKDFVPVWLACRTMTHQSDDNQDSTGLGSVPPRAAYAWRLKKSLYVPAREPIVAEFYFPATESSGGSYGTVYFIIHGRSLLETAPIPEFVDVPYCASFLGAQNSPGNNPPAPVNTTEQTYERDLSNGFGVPLKVDYLTGRVSVNNVQGGGGLGAYDCADASGVTALGGFSSASAATNVLVRAVSSIGSICVRDKTPFNLLFYAPEHAWRVNAVLPPKGFFKFFLTENLGNIVNGVTNNAYRVGIGMVGSRQVSTRAWAGG